MAEEWMVASDASDEEGSSSLGYEGLGGPPKRTRTFAEPGDLELAELYRRVARDGYIELQCIEEKTTSSAGLEERNDTSTATDDFKINQLLDKTKEAKVETPPVHDSTFDFCEDTDVVKTTPQTAQKSAIKGAKKRKAKSVGKWNNVIRHLQRDYNADNRTQHETAQDSGKVQNYSVEEPFVQASEEQSVVAASGYHISFSLSSMNSSMTKDGLQDKIRHAEMLLASQQANR